MLAKRTKPCLLHTITVLCAYRNGILEIVRKSVRVGARQRCLQQTPENTTSLPQCCVTFTRIGGLPFSQTVTPYTYFYLNLILVIYPYLSNVIYVTQAMVLSVTATIFVPDTFTLYLTHLP